MIIIWLIELASDFFDFLGSTPFQSITIDFNKIPFSYIINFIKISNLFIPWETILDIFSVICIIFLWKLVVSIFQLIKSVIPLL